MSLQNKTDGAFATSAVVTTSANSNPVALNGIVGYAIVAAVTVDSGVDAACAIKLQASIDGTTYVDIASSSQPITATANFMWNVDAPYYELVRVAVVLVSGQVTYTAKIVTKANI